MTDSNNKKRGDEYVSVNVLWEIDGDVLLTDIGELYTRTDLYLMREEGNPDALLHAAKVRENVGVNTTAGEGRVHHVYIVGNSETLL